MANTSSADMAARHSSLYWVFSDGLTLIRRNLSHIINNPDQLISMVIQPVMFMLLFRYVFGGAIQTEGTTYVNFLVAGVIVQGASFGATTTSIGVATDLQRGIIDRFRSLPMFAGAVLVGHTFADLVRNMVSSTIMIGVAFLVGFRPTASALQWVAAIGILLLYTLAISWLSAILGLLAKSIEAVQWFGFIAIFPLTFASSAFVETKGMPVGLRIFADNQPVTHVINAIRSLLVGTPIGNEGWLAVIWCVGILAFSVPYAAFLFRRYSSK